MLKLPNELMDHVDGLCDTNTRLLLRQTCRQWQVVARARFAAEHFGDRQYYFDAETLHDLVQITADQNLAPYIRRITSGISHLFNHRSYTAAKERDRSRASYVDEYLELMKEHVSCGSLSILLAQALHNLQSMGIVPALGVKAVRGGCMGYRACARA